MKNGIKRLLAAFLLALPAFAGSLAAESPDFAEPDFAFPADVIAHARKAIGDADKNAAASGPQRLRALTELVAAEAAISPDSLLAMPALIASQANVPGISDSDRAMLKALEAAVLVRIYNTKPYAYNNVQGVRSSYPANVAEWSAAMFCKRVQELFGEAYSLARTAPVPVLNYEGALNISPEMAVYLPEIPDLLRDMAVTAAGTFVRNNVSTPAYRDSICAAAIADTKGAPYIYWSCRKASFASDNTSAYKDLYLANRNEESARLALLYWAEKVAPEAKGRMTPDNEAVELLRESLEKFPSWYNNNALRNALAAITCPRVTFKSRDFIGLGSQAPIQWQSVYADNVTFKVYKTESGAFSTAQLVEKHEPAYTFSADTHGAACDSIFRFDASAPGYYAIVPFVNGDAVGSTAPTFVYATPLFPAIVSGSDRNAAVVVDFASGKPLKGVELLLEYKQNGQDCRESKGVTDSKGILLFENDKNSTWGRQAVYSYKGTDYNMANRMYFYNYGTVLNQDTVYKATLILDRPLYHAGDSVKWVVAAASRVAKDAPAILPGKKVKVSLFDANNRVVADTSCVTDKYGRASGSFITRKDALTGEYRMAVEIESANAAWLSFPVSDFKLPTFTAEITELQRGVPAQGDVRVSGLARTFAGMPVIGAAVELNVKGMEMWRWMGGAEVSLGSFEAVTDEKGAFSIVIPASTLAEPWNNGSAFRNFVAEVFVKARDGEVQAASKGFSQGKPYFLSVADVPACADSSDKLSFLVKAFDANGESRSLPLAWTLTDAQGKTVLQGNVNAGEKAGADIAALGAGIYKMNVAPADTALAASVQTGDIVIYNVARNELPPLNVPMFVPVTSCNVEKGKIRVTVGVIAEKAYVYTAIDNNGALGRFECRELKRGFHTLEMKVPSDCGTIPVFTVSDGQLCRTDVQPVFPPEPSLEIVAESFRDNIVPESLETWRFRLSRGAKGVGGAPVVARMFNKALSSLTSGDGMSEAKFYSAGYQLVLNSIWNTFATRFGYLPVGDAREVTLDNPSFRYIAGNYGATPRLLVRGSSATGYTRDLAMNTMVTEKVAAAADVAESGAEIPAEISYRPAEMLQAFWMPSLLTDESGNVELTFTVPNSLGEWTFDAMAWDARMDFARFASQCVANKPVMVQPNLPRFLRQGDRPAIMATVFNNTGKNADVDVTVTVFDPFTTNVIAEEKVVRSIAADASSVVALTFDIPAGLSAVGYRVQAAAEGFRDGEQSLVPVLSDESTIVESSQFYLSPGDKDYEVSIDVKEGDKVSLMYCGNPLWTVVKAMRGIAANNSSTANSIADRLFSALAAKHIVSANPAVAEAIATWKANPSEDALTSMLEKNSELKTLLLDRTPWVGAAADNTMRMAALAELLDASAVDARIASLCDELEKLQNADGAFRWGSWSGESSEWVTRYVLSVMGVAKSLGFFESADSRVAGICGKAFEAMQQFVAKRDKFDSDVDFAMIAANFPEQSLDASSQKLVDNTLKAVEAGWKKASLADKAVAVLLLKAAGKDAVAATIMSSIRQFGVVRPGQGLCFPSVNDMQAYAVLLQAYVAMKAPEADIDAMRQWVILQAQANDDLASRNPDYIIAAVLLSGSVWTDASGDSSVVLNGKALDIARSESFTGYFVEQLPVLVGKNTIAVHANGVTPSYGSVITVSNRPAESVEAVAGKDISIEKQLFVYRNGAWISAGNIGLGDRVRVQLTVNAGREMEYVAITDERGACFEPLEQLPSYVMESGLGYYRENLDASTDIFINRLPKGTWQISYEVTASLAGSYTSGVATIQSQYAPELTAHSAGAEVNVK